MPKDLFIFDTNTKLNKTIKEAFEKKGYEVEVAEGIEGIPNDAVAKASEYRAVAIFVNRKMGSEQLNSLLKEGSKTKLILCASAGFDNVPIDICKEKKIRVGRVPSYSPGSIAEYALTSILTLAKNVQRSYDLTRECNYSVGSLDCILMEDKTVGVIGTGQIGKKAVEKIAGLVKKVLCFDAYQSPDWIKTIPNAEYVAMPELLAKSHAISIHVPLLPDTKYLINKENIAKMKDNVILVNTSRGEIVNTKDLVEGLKSGKIYGAALDVFENEKQFIFKDCRKCAYEGYPELQELSKMDNVILSSHVAFYTDESIRQITEKTLKNFEEFFNGTVDEFSFVC